MPESSSEYIWRVSQQVKHTHTGVIESLVRDSKRKRDEEEKRKKRKRNNGEKKKKGNREKQTKWTRKKESKTEKLNANK